jgi:hypothetical protein
LDRKKDDEGKDAEAPDAAVAGESSTAKIEMDRKNSKTGKQSRWVRATRKPSKSNRREHENVVVHVANGELEIEAEDESASSGSHSEDDFTAPNQEERQGDITMAAPRSPGSGDDADDSSDEEDAIAPSRRERRGSILYAQTRTAAVPPAASERTEISRKPSRKSKSATKSASTRRTKSKGEDLASQLDTPDSSTRMIPTTVSSSSSSS